MKRTVFLTTLTAALAATTVSATTVLSSKKTTYFDREALMASSYHARITKMNKYTDLYVISKSSHDMMDVDGDNLMVVKICAGTLQRTEYPFIHKCIVYSKQELLDTYPSAKGQMNKGNIFTVFVPGTLA